MDRLTGAGCPTHLTVGEVGQFYENTNTGDIYECRSITKDGDNVLNYAWELRVHGDHVDEHAELFGGGGGSTSKYTQPEWGAETAIVDILPEATHTALQVQDGMAVYSLPAAQYTLVDGKAYEVNYNGTAYNCICHEQKDGTDGGFYALGNVGLLEIEGWEMTDHPFVIAFNYGTTIEENGVAAQMISLDGSETVTLSIKGEGEIIHPIPSEFTGVLYVTLGGEKYTADKTPDEIKTALNAGRIVIARGEMKVGGETAGYSYSTWYYSFTGISKDGLPIFSNLFLQTNIQINEDGTYTPVNLG